MLSIQVQAAVICFFKFHFSLIHVHIQNSVQHNHISMGHSSCCTKTSNTSWNYCWICTSDSFLKLTIHRGFHSPLMVVLLILSNGTGKCKALELAMLSILPWKWSLPWSANAVRSITSRAEDWRRSALVLVLLFFFPVPYRLPYCTASFTGRYGSLYAGAQ